MTKEDLQQFSIILDDKLNKRFEDFSKVFDKKLDERFDKFEIKINKRFDKCLTKEDAKNFLTKEDAKSFATKDDLKNFATKDDLKNFATKDDLKNEIESLARMVAEGFKHQGDQIARLTSDVGGLKNRVSRLEVKVEDGFNLCNQKIFDLWSVVSSHGYYLKKLEAYF